MNKGWLRASRNARTKLCGRDSWREPAGHHYKRDTIVGEGQTAEKEETVV